MVRGAPSVPPYLGRVKDLLHLQDVGDVPRVLGEGPQGKGVFADEGWGRKTELGGAGGEEEGIKGGWGGGKCA